MTTRRAKNHKEKTQRELQRKRFNREHDMNVKYWSDVVFLQSVIDFCKHLNEEKKRLNGVQNNEDGTGEKML